MWAPAADDTVRRLCGWGLVNEVPRVCSRLNASHNESICLKLYRKIYPQTKFGCIVTRCDSALQNSFQSPLAQSADMTANVRFWPLTYCFSCLSILFKTRTPYHQLRTRKTDIESWCNSDQESPSLYPNHGDVTSLMMKSSAALSQSADRQVSLRKIIAEVCRCVPPM